MSQCIGTSTGHSQLKLGHAWPVLLRWRAHQMEDVVDLILLILAWSVQASTVMLEALLVRDACGCSMTAHRALQSMQLLLPAAAHAWSKPKASQQVCVPAHQGSWRVHLERWAWQPAAQQRCSPRSTCPPQDHTCQHPTAGQVACHIQQAMHGFIQCTPIAPNSRDTVIETLLC